MTFIPNQHLAQRVDRVARRNDYTAVNRAWVIDLIKFQSGDRVVPGSRYGLTVDRGGFGDLGRIKKSDLAVRSPGESDGRAFLSEQVPVTGRQFVTAATGRQPLDRTD